jgi:hypothetical protein
MLGIGDKAPPFDGSKSGFNNHEEKGKRLRTSDREELSRK